VSWIDPAGIHNVENNTCPFRLGYLAISRCARDIINDR
jgi:hypothetical protein